MNHKKKPTRFNYQCIYRPNITTKYHYQGQEGQAQNMIKHITRYSEALGNTEYLGKTQLGNQSNIAI